MLPLSEMGKSDAFDSVAAKFQENPIDFKKLVDVYSDPIKSAGEDGRVMAEKAQKKIFQILEELAKNPKLGYEDIDKNLRDLDSIIELDNTMLQLGWANKATKHPFPWHLKGLLFAMKKNYEESIKCFGKAIELCGVTLDEENRDDILLNCLFLKGLQLAYLGKYEEAFKCIDKATELDPNGAEPWYAKAEIHRSLGHTENAIICFGKVTKLNPKDGEAWGNMGSLFKDSGNTFEALECFEEALKCYDKSIELDPKDARHWYNKGLALDGLQKYEEAIKCYDKVIEIDPKHVEAWYFQGIDFLELARPEEALKCFDKVIELDPSNEGAKEIIKKIQDVKR